MPSGDFPLIVWENKSGNYGATGWICPRCGRGLAPWVSECPHCRPVISHAGVPTGTTIPANGIIENPDTSGNGEKQYPSGYNPYGPNGFYDIGF